MSNISELISKINEPDGTTLNLIGAAIGTIADFTGVIPVIQFFSEADRK